MSSFVTRHTRAQLTTENVVFDKVLLLLVLFVQMEMVAWHGIAAIFHCRQFFLVFLVFRFSFLLYCCFAVLILTHSHSPPHSIVIYFFLVRCIFTLLWSHTKTQKRIARYACIFICMYNVLDSAIITIIQLCGLCRLFVHIYVTAVAFAAAIAIAIATATAADADVVTIPWANIHHQLSKLCLYFVAAVDSSIRVFFFSPLFFFCCFCFSYCFFPLISVLDLFAYGWETFTCFLCTFVVDVGSVSAANVMECDFNLNPIVKRPSFQLPRICYTIWFFAFLSRLPG